MYGVHKENWTYKDIKIYFFHITGIVERSELKMWRLNFFKPYELKKRDHYWQKINFKGWKKRKICSTHLMTSDRDPPLPLMMSKMQCTNFCLSLPHPLFLYKKSALVKKKTTNNESSSLWSKNHNWKNGIHLSKKTFIWSKGAINVFEFHNPISPKSNNTQNTILQIEH